MLEVNKKVRTKGKGKGVHLVFDCLSLKTVCRSAKIELPSMLQRKKKYTLSYRACCSDRRNIHWIQNSYGQNDSKRVSMLLKSVKMEENKTLQLAWMGKE